MIFSPLPSPALLALAPPACGPRCAAAFSSVWLQAMYACLHLLSLYLPPPLSCSAEAAKSQAIALRRRIDFVIPIGSDPSSAGDGDAQADPAAAPAEVVRREAAAP